MCAQISPKPSVLAEPEQDTVNVVGPNAVIVLATSSVFASGFGFGLGNSPLPFLASANGAATAPASLLMKLRLFTIQFLYKIFCPFIYRSA
jgi:hypothetical protein